MDPRLFALVGLLFLGIGAFTIVLARKRRRYARSLGQPVAWYKDLTLLTGFEYTLLGVNIFLDQLKNWIPAPLQPVFGFFFAGVLLLTVVLLLGVVFLLIKRPRQAVQVKHPTSTIDADTDTLSPAEQAAKAQRKRERRQKAASARRRHAGRA